MYDIVTCIYIYIYNFIVHVPNNLVFQLVRNIISQGKFQLLSLNSTIEVLD